MERVLLFRPVRISTHRGANLVPDRGTDRWAVNGAITCANCAAHYDAGHVGSHRRADRVHASHPGTNHAAPDRASVCRAIARCPERRAFVDRSDSDVGSEHDAYLGPIYWPDVAADDSFRRACRAHVRWMWTPPCPRHVLCSGRCRIRGLLDRAR